MAYWLLNWVGPISFDEICLTNLPATSGVYIFTNSPSPFAFASYNSFKARQLSQPLKDTPSVLYIGCTSKSIRDRIASHHARPREDIKDKKNLFLYWAMTAKPLSIEKELITNLFPLLNRFPRLNHSPDHFTMDDRIKILNNMLSEKVSSEEEYQKFFELNP